MKIHTIGDITLEDGEVVCPGVLLTASVEEARGLSPLLFKSAVLSPGWQPIETAPKDGTRFLSICATDDDPYRSIEITEWYVLPCTHFELIEGDLYRKVEDKPMEGWNGNTHRATHWMPLPELPEPSE